MPAAPIAIRASGLVTSVGLSAPAACAAMRCKLTNPSETRFIDSAGEWIMGHGVALEQP
jgi:3-oxoacyl-[acyl-carrier-protein] synthase-1